MKSIYINDQLHYQLKLFSVNTGKKMMDLVGEFIQQGLLKLQRQTITNHPEEKVLSLLNSLRKNAKNFPNPEFDFTEEEKGEFSQMAKVTAPTISTIFEEKE
ncbi:hypothetical protein KKH56_07580 [bacterium]|nr:hypothetical protein [bacterium]